MGIRTFNGGLVATGYVLVAQIQFKAAKLLGREQGQDSPERLRGLTDKSQVARMPMEHLTEDSRFQSQSKKT